jgi:hypothetical protein
MGRRKPIGRAAIVLFDVFYEDGTVTSNWKVPASALGGLDEDASARAVIEAQDREIVGRSGHPRSRIKAMCRADRRDAAQRRLARLSDQARKARQ